MKQSKLIIIEGPQGTGKTTLSNFLRDNMLGSNLYRLSGQKDKTQTGLNYSVTMYNALLDYLNVMQNIPMDIIFDRTFMTEEVYARLGYKEYSFTDIYNELLKKLSMLNYDIYYFSLYLKDVNLFKKRLARDSHHNYQEFSSQNSIDQQNMYLKICDDLSRFENIHITKLEMDDFKTAYDKVKRILKIN